jgi:hypothetical protein
VLESGQEHLSILAASGTRAARNNARICAHTHALIHRSAQRSSCEPRQATTCWSPNCGDQDAWFFQEQEEGTAVDNISWRRCGVWLEGWVEGVGLPPDPLHLLLNRTLHFCSRCLAATTTAVQELQSTSATLNHALQPLPPGKTLALKTVVCYLPHPEKVIVKGMLCGTGFRRVARQTPEGFS